MNDFGTLPLLIFSTSKYFRWKQPCSSFYSRPNIPDRFVGAQLNIYCFPFKFHWKMKEWSWSCRWFIWSSSLWSLLAIHYTGNHDPYQCPNGFYDFMHIRSFEPVYNMRLSWRSFPTLLLIAQSPQNVGHNEAKLDHGAKILWPSCYGGSHVCPIYLAQQRSTQSFRAQRTIQPNPYGLRCYPNLVPFQQHQKLQFKWTYMRFVTTGGRGNFFLVLWFFQKTTWEL